MKTKFRRLAFAAMLLSGTSMTIADDGAFLAAENLPGSGTGAYFEEAGDITGEVAAESATDLAPTGHVESPSTFVGTSDFEEYSPTHQFVGSELSDSIGASRLLPAAYETGYEAYPTAVPQPAAGCDTGCDAACDAGCDSGCNVGCDSGCDGGCDSGCVTRRRRICNIFDRVGNNGWAQTELLLWFAQDRDMPALVTTSTPPGSFPVLPNADVVFGDDIDGELSAGFRGDYGKWVTDTLGLGGRFWILGENTDSYSNSGDGSVESIGRPFYNTDTNAEDALLVAQDGIFEGSVAGESSLDIFAAEGYARVRFSCAKNCRLDFIGGYSYFDIEDELRITSTTVNLINTGGNPPGTERTFSDLFESENRFNGGQLGFEMVIKRGRWMARSLTKVHLGNMEQRVRIDGQRTRTLPGAPPVVTNSDGGMLAQGNQGNWSRDVFAFVPEANFKLAYCLQDNIRLSVGYSFIYWDNVVLNGDVIDRNVDGNSFGFPGTFGPRPSFEFNDSSLWVQGIDLGVVIDF